MARYLPYGDLSLPSQGSSQLQELVKHFESDVSFDNLQTQINVWLLLLGTPFFINRPAIREITFEVHETGQPMPVIMYYAQVHYVLVGDGDDAPNI